MKNQKGITLVALVVTIIVLLILAGISIVMLSGENGLLKRESDTEVTDKVSDAKVQVSLVINDLVTAYYEEKYTNSTPTTPITDTLGQYVAKNLPIELQKEEYSDIAEATEDESTNNAIVKLKQKDKDGKTLQAVYDSSTAKLSTFTAVE